MKCEICGNEMAMWTEGQKTHSYLETCVSVFERRLEDANKENAILKAKLAAQPVSKTKAERFERLRELISHSGGYAGSYTWDYLVDEVKDLLAAHTEAKILMIEHNRPIFCGDDFANWLQKWA